MKFNLNNAEFLLSAGKESQFIRDGKPQIALSGRSNVGKSSLINTVLGRKKLARTSSEPGKTITVNYYGVDKKFYFVDLPGYGYARRSESEKKIWSALTNGYLTGECAPDFVLQLIDLKVGPTGDDCMMLDWLHSSGIPFAVVATKADKLNKTERKRNYEALLTHPLINPAEAEEKTKVIAFSSLTGEGKDEVISVINEHIK